MKLTDTERKTKRLQLLIRPSLYGKLSRLRQITGLSVNEIVNQMVERQIDEVLRSYEHPDVIHERNETAAGKETP